jgi:hypothetical protein
MGREVRVAVQVRLGVVSHLETLLKALDGLMCVRERATPTFDRVEDRGEPSVEEKLAKLLFQRRLRSCEHAQGVGAMMHDMEAFAFAVHHADGAIADDVERFLAQEVGNDKQAVPPKSRDILANVGGGAGASRAVDDPRKDRSRHLNPECVQGAALD